MFAGRHIGIGLLFGAAFLAGCSGTSGEASVASPDEWTETTIVREFDGRQFLKRVSPDGRWLAVTDLVEVCIYPLDEGDQSNCFEEETLGGDSLHWNADSTLVTSGSSTSGRWNTTGVWTFAPDGTATSVSPVSAGSPLIPDEPGVFNGAMAFRPDGESIVFIQSEFRDGPDSHELREVDIDGGNETVLAQMDGFALGRIVPLEDGRLVVVAGESIGPPLVLIDGGEQTTIAMSEPSDQGGYFPRLATQATSAAGGLALVVLPGEFSARNLILEPSAWSLFDFEGQEFPITVADGQTAVAATFSPDGTSLAYLVIDIPENLASALAEAVPISSELFITTVDAVLAGEPATTSRALEADAMSLLDPSFLELNVMRWSTDDRILIPLQGENENEVTVVEVDLSGQ